MLQNTTFCDIAINGVLQTVDWIYPKSIESSWLSSQAATVGLHVELPDPHLSNVIHQTLSYSVYINASSWFVMLNTSSHPFDSQEIWIDAMILFLASRNGNELMNIQVIYSKQQFHSEWPHTGREGGDAFYALLQ